MRMVKIVFIETVHSVHLHHTNNPLRPSTSDQKSTGASWRCFSLSWDALHSKQFTHYVFIYTTKLSL